MIVKFEYKRELPTHRLGDGLPDWESPQYEKVSGELNVEMFLNQISKEVGIKDIKIFNNNENG
tara:strand:+ start:1373 stop:1561 length:189 start_codon:yes stop_codon:yes gene_type:complete